MTLVWKWLGRELLTRAEAMRDLHPYLQRLKQCQRDGLRIGVVNNNGWPCVAYLLNGKQYRFRKGIVVMDGAS